MNHLNVRHMMLQDLDFLVKLERETNTLVFDVPFIGQCECLAAWAWTRQDILAAIRQVRLKNLCTFEARVFVAGTTEELHGFAVVESQDEGFAIRRLSGANDEARRALVTKILAMAASSRKRRRLTCVVSDGDWAALRYFVRLGWQRTLLPSYCLDGRDAWFIETIVPAAKQPARRW